MGLTDSLLSVIVPAYGEGHSIYGALQQLLAALEALDRPYEVIVVSDGNTDDTVKEATRLESHVVKVVHYEPNRGKGYALRHGISLATGDLIAFIDADMELHPSGIGHLIEILTGTGADVVIGTKTHPESLVYYPLFRRFQSRVYRRIVRALFRLDVSDTQTGLKVFRRAALDEVAPFLQSDGFAFDLELLVLINDAGFSIEEGPVHLDYRFASTTGARAIVDVLRDTARIAIRRRRLRSSGAWQARRRSVRAE
jgi:glycosyltransferase involved in cell wall biosynthesis